MAITRILSNNFKFELGRGNIDFNTGDFRVILMQGAGVFTFSKASHGQYVNVKASELPAGNGYNLITKPVTPAPTEEWQQDNGLNKASVTWENPTWTAAGGDIGPTDGAIVLQYDSTTPDNSIVVGYIGFGEDIVIADTVSFQLQEMGFDLFQVS